MTLLKISLWQWTVIVVGQQVDGFLWKHKKTNLIYPTFHLWWCTSSQRHLSGKASLYAEILTLYTLLIMTSTCCACEALPFKHCWENSTLWKWAALPRALQQRDRKVRAFHTRQSPAHRLEPSQSEEVCKIRFHQDTIRMNYCSRKCLKLNTAQVKSTTQTYLVAPSDKLFIVWSGELRVQCHHLQ